MLLLFVNFAFFYILFSRLRYYYCYYFTKTRTYYCARGLSQRPPLVSVAEDPLARFSTVENRFFSLPLAPGPPRVYSYNTRRRYCYFHNCCNYRAFKARRVVPACVRVCFCLCFFFFLRPDATSRPRRWCIRVREQHCRARYPASVARPSVTPTGRERPVAVGRPRRPNRRRRPVPPAAAAGELDRVPP